MHIIFLINILFLSECNIKREYKCPRRRHKSRVCLYQNQLDMPERVIRNLPQTPDSPLETIQEFLKKICHFHNTDLESIVEHSEIKACWISQLCRAESIQTPAVSKLVIITVKRIMTTASSVQAGLPPAYTHSHYGQKVPQCSKALEEIKTKIYTCIANQLNRNNNEHYLVCVL